jgi:HEAT repeat protein
MAETKRIAVAVKTILLSLTTVLFLVTASLPLPVGAADTAGLFLILKGSVGLEGDIALTLKTQDSLTALGRQNPQVVVPEILQELRGLDQHDRKTDEYRMSLFSVIEGIGPAAEAAVPLLESMVQGEGENEWVLFKVQSALLAINSPRAREVGKEGESRTVDRWLQKATPEEVSAAVAQHAYFIRRELRRTEPGEEMIGASVSALLQMGASAGGAVLELKEAWSDPRIGAHLRPRIEEALSALGVDDFHVGGRRPDAIEGIAADVNSDNQLVSTFSMMELGELGPSDRAIEILMTALRDGRNPGQAALVLGGFGTAAAKAAPLLLPYLDDRYAGPNAIQALGRIGSEDKDSLHALRRIVAEEGPHRAIAASVLGTLESSEALPELQQALFSKNKYTRILAARSLGSLEATAAVPSLAALLEDPDNDVRKAAVEALGNMGPTAASAVPLIARQLQYPDGRLKAGALAALEKIGGDEARAALEEDGKRYSSTDRAEYHRLRNESDLREVDDFLSGLPLMRRVPLAREMLEDEDLSVALRGAEDLIAAGFEEETYPLLARVIASGESRGETGSRAVYVIGCGGGTGLADPVVDGLRRYLSGNIDNFSDGEKARIEQWISSNQ